MPPTPSSREHGEVQMVIVGFVLTVIVSLPIAWFVADNLAKAERVRLKDQELQSVLYGAPYTLQNAAEETGTFPTTLPETIGEAITTEESLTYTTTDAGRSFKLCVTFSNGTEECTEGQVEERPTSRYEQEVRFEEASFEGSTLTSPTFNFRVTFPDTWSHSPVEQGGALVTSFSPGSYASFRLWTTAVSDTELEWFVDLRKGKLSTDLAKFTVVVDKETTFQGVPARLVEYTWTGSNGVASRTRMLLFIAGEYFYEFDETAAAGSFSTFASDFNSIEASFELLR